MKKILSVLLCMVLLLGLLVVPANATDDVVTFSITTDHEGVLLRGQEITCVVYVNGTVSVDQIGYLMKDTLDTDVFEFTRVASHIKKQEEDWETGEMLPAAPEGAAVVEASAAQKGVAIAWDAPVTLPGSLKLSTFKLKVKDTAPFGDVAITANGSANLGSTRYAVDVQGLTVTIAKCVGHQYGAWTKVDETNHARTCPLCNDVETVAHNWDEGVVNPNPTCGVGGTKTYTCKDNCGATKTEPVPATGNHTAGKWVKVDETTHKRTCSVCGKNEETDSHEWGTGVLTTPNDCGNDGVMTYTCACGATKTEPVAATGNHTAGAWTKVDETTHKRVCSVCGKNEETDSHTWDAGVIDPNPTCGAGGTKTYTCTEGCGATKTEPVPATGLHTAGNWVKVDDNTHKRVCAVCGGNEETDSHNWDNGTVTTNPDCDSTGVKTFTCTDNCGATKTEPVPATGLHTAGAWTKVDENTHKRVCTGCGGNEETDSHNWDNGTVTTNPDCDSTGVKTYTCTDNCGATKTEPVPATGLHTAGAWTKVDENTHKRVCTGCGGNEETDSHNWDNGVVNPEPTCGEYGIKTFTCTDGCGATRIGRIEPTGNHTAGAWVKVNETTHKRVCSVCGKNEETASHTWNAGEVTTNPGCGSEGVKTFTCTEGCGATKTEPVPATGNHTWDEGVVTKNPTAAADGIVTHGCVDCDATKEVPFNVAYEIVADKEAVKRGEEITYTIYISSNKALTNVSLDLNLDSNIFEVVGGETKLPGATNSFDEANGFGAVFAEAQMVEGKVVFGTITVKVKEDADFGDIKVQGTPSVQGGSGNLAYAFAAVPTVKIECNTHTFSAWTKVDDKDHIHTCSVCQKAETAAHKWDAGKVTVEATETKVGEKTFTCADCGAVKTEEIAKTNTVTADTMNPALYMILMVLAVAGVAVVTVGKKKFHG